MVMVTLASPQGSSYAVSCAWEHSQGKKFLWWSHPSPHVPPYNGAFFLWWAQASSQYTQTQLGIVSTPNPGPLPGIELWNLNFSTQAPLSLTEECLRLGEHRLAVLTLCAGYPLFCLPQTCCCSLPLRLQKSPSVQYDLSTGEETSQGVGNFLPSQLLPKGSGLFFFFFLQSYPIMQRGFLKSFLGMSEVFCDCSFVIILLFMFSRQKISL